jgi:Lrp/AsnC family leucine-responsive transcriptional regulator
MTLNHIDYKILDLLQKNARMTQSEIATAVGLSQPAVAERMRKLETEGIITGYAAHIDSRKLGKDITAFVGVRIDHPKYNDDFSKKILALPDVLECHRVSGADSYLLKVVVDNTEHLDQLICGCIRIIPGVTSTHTTIVMSKVKEGTHIKPLAETTRAPKQRR